MPSSYLNYPIVNQRIQAVRSLIENRINVHHTDIENALVTFLNAGGKMLRPAFCILFAQFGDEDSETINKIAASLEILHMATLIHDDIIDESDLRRNQPSIQAQFDKVTAVYAGDLLFTRFFELINETMNGTEYLAINSQSMSHILMGELNQRDARFDTHRSIADYTESISGKTAELFRLAALEGAHFANANPEIEALATEIGWNVGMAFQINDDILDYTSKDNILRKPALEDLHNGDYSLPLLFALKTNRQAITALLEKRSDLTDYDANQLATLVQTAGGIDAAITEAQNYTTAAITAIQQLPAGRPRKALTSLANRLLTRTY